MQNIGATGQRIFWCPRCGTLRTTAGDFTEDEPTYWMKRIAAGTASFSGAIVGGVPKIAENPPAQPDLAAEVKQTGVAMMRAAQPL